MSTNIDFDISSYSTEELINIIGIGGVLPLTNEKIVKKIQEMKDQFEGKYQDDEYTIKVNNIIFLNKTSNERINNLNLDDEDIFGIYFNPYDDNEYLNNWNKWSTGDNSKDFTLFLNELLNTNAVFAEYIEDNIETTNL